MPPRKPKPRACPGCGCDSTFTDGVEVEQHYGCADMKKKESCAKCGLPCTLWPRWEAAVELALDVVTTYTALRKPTDVWAKLARRVLKGER